MRLVELLIVLIMEGRKALPKAVQPLVSRRMENFPGDRSHRHVIEAIRAGNNDEFFEAMESGECLPSCYITRKSLHYDFDDPFLAPVRICQDLR